jgi:hypothetical protein
LEGVATTAKNGEDLTMTVEFLIAGAGNLAMWLESVRLIRAGVRPCVALAEPTITITIDCGF